MASLRRIPFTRWELDGRRVPKGTPGAASVRRLSAKWYGCGVPGFPPGKRVPLSANKRLAEQMLAELIARAQRGLLGLPDPAALARPLADYLADYRGWMTGNGCGAVHLGHTAARLARLAAAAGFAAPADLLLPGAKMKAERAVQGFADAGRTTQGYYLREWRTFCRYLHDELEVLPRNPFAGRRKRKGAKGARDEPGRARRALAPAELAALMDAAAASPDGFRGLLGPQRAALYATAAGTGFRAEELSKFRRRSFDLAADPPVAALAGPDTKSGRPARLPLPPGLVAMLEPLLAPLAPADPVWPGKWWKRAADMIAADLAAAGVAYSLDRPDGGTAVADFHALRHFFTSNIVSGGASVKAAQTLARHSTPVLTIGTYSHATDRELAEAVGRLPVVGATESDPLAGWSRADLRAAVEGLSALLRAVLGLPSGLP